MAIFLDLLGSEAAAGTAHLLDPSFSGVFNDDEKALRDALEGVRTAAAGEKVRAGLKRAVDDALEMFGG